MSQDLRTRLKEARRKLDLTQAGAAREWGVPLNTLICWENNRRHPAAFTLSRLNHLLDAILDSQTPIYGSKDPVSGSPLDRHHRLPRSDDGGGGG